MTVLPATALAAPPGGLSAQRATLPAPESPPVSDQRTRSERGPFKVPFDVDAQPRSHSGAAESPLLISPQLMFSPYRLRRSTFGPTYWYQPTGWNDPCSINGATPLGVMQPPPPDVTIGSLVDGRQSLFSSTPSYNAAGATLSGNTGAVAAPGTASLQVGFAPTACGSQYLAPF